MLIASILVASLLLGKLPPPLAEAHVALGSVTISGASSVLVVTGYNGPRGHNYEVDSIDGEKILECQTNIEYLDADFIANPKISLTNTSSVNTISFTVVLPIRAFGSVNSGTDNTWANLLIEFRVGATLYGRAAGSAGGGNNNMDYNDPETADFVIVNLSPLGEESHSGYCEGNAHVPG